MLNIKWMRADVGGPLRPAAADGEADTYRQVAEQLMAQGDAYHCYCTPEELEAERKAALAEGRPPRYSGKCARLTDEERARLDASGAKRVVRLKVPETTLSFVDLVRGEQHKNMAERGDFVIIKSDGSPVYNFATVVDEHLMEITHVFRAVEHLTNTFDQLAVPRAARRSSVT